MKSRILAGCTLILLLLGLTGQPQAAPWYQPDGLSAGETYQLAFVTSTVTDATRSDLQYYFDFVNAAAALNPDLAQFNFRPIISNETNDAQFVAYVWGPVYNLNGDMVATNKVDMWDGRLLAPISHNQHQQSVSSKVWTKTTTTGIYKPTIHPPAPINTTFVGHSMDVGNGWIDREYRPTWAEYPLYALSDPISAVPVPAALWLLGSGLLAMVGIRRKHH